MPSPVATMAMLGPLTQRDAPVARSGTAPTPAMAKPTPSKARRRRALWRSPATKLPLPCSKTPGTIAAPIARGSASSSGGLARLTPSAAPSNATQATTISHRLVRLGRAVAANSTSALWLDSRPLPRMMPERRDRPGPGARSAGPAATTRRRESRPGHAHGFDSAGPHPAAADPHACRCSRSPRHSSSAPPE